MDKNRYADFFERLKACLTELGIDEEKQISGCTEQEITAMEARYGNFPLAYKEYMRLMGRHYLFQFMDAEDMSYASYDYIQEFGQRVFEENDMDRGSYLVISERRDDYISLIRTDQGDNPEVWIMSECWDKSDEGGDNLEVRTESFTGLMIAFFRACLRNHTAGFHFVNESDAKNKNTIHNRYVKWSRAVTKLVIQADEYRGDNTLVKELNTIISKYYDINKKQFAYFANTGYLKAKQSTRPFIGDIVVGAQETPSAISPSWLSSFFNQLMNFIRL